MKHAMCRGVWYGTSTRTIKTWINQSVSIKQSTQICECDINIRIKPNYGENYRFDNDCGNEEVQKNCDKETIIEFLQMLGSKFQSGF